MANEQNLRPSEHKLTEDEAKKGGKKSAELRSLKSTVRKQLAQKVPKKGMAGMVRGWPWDPEIPSLDGQAGVAHGAQLRVPSVCWVFTTLTAARRLASSSPDSGRN